MLAEVGLVVAPGRCQIPGTLAVNRSGDADSACTGKILADGILDSIDEPGCWAKEREAVKVFGDFTVAAVRHYSSGVDPARGLGMGPPPGGVSLTGPGGLVDRQTQGPGKTGNRLWRVQASI